MSDPEDRFFKQVIINALTVGLRHVDPLSLDEPAARAHYEELAAREVAQVRAYGQPRHKHWIVDELQRAHDPIAVIREMTDKIIAADPTHVCPVCGSWDLPPHVHPVHIEINGNHGVLHPTAAERFGEEINAVAARRRGRP